MVKQDKIASALAFWGVLLAPLIVLPLSSLSLDVGKKYFLLSAIFLSLAFWLWARYKDKEIVFPASKLLYASGGVVLAALLSALASKGLRQSLVGYGFEPATFISIFAFFALLFLSAVYFQSPKRTMNFYLGVFVMFAVVFLFQLILTFKNITPWAIFDNRAANLIGKWYDLGVFAGFISISSLIFIELFSLEGAKFLRYAVGTVLTLALLLVALVNYPALWWAILLFSLFVAGYKYFLLKRWSYPSLAVALLALVFVAGGTFLSGPINRFDSKLGISSLLVRPSFTETLWVAENTLKDDPFLGAGPNKFNIKWHQYKTVAVNAGPFWNNDFDQGFSVFLTSIATTGLLGLLSWLAFVAVFLWVGLRSVLTPAIGLVSKSFNFLVFAGAAFLWTFSAVYTPGSVILALTFVLTGILVGSTVSSGLIPNWKFGWGDGKRTLPAVALFLLALGVATMGYFTVVNVWSVIDFNRSYAAINTKGDLAEGEELLRHAVKLSPQDVYYRNLVDLDFAKLNRLLGQSSLSEADLRASFLNITKDATNDATAAIVLAPDNYQNYRYRARVYESLIPLGVLGAYEKAEKDYNKAITLDPQNPSIYLDLARLALANKNLERAKENLARAIELKSDYADAIFLQAQIYSNEGRIDEAIAQARKAVALSPTDAGVLFQLGYLYYRDADYMNALDNLERAMKIVPSANTKYFLGLVYDKLEMRGEAIRLFEEISAQNPDNAEARQILANLRAGRGALDKAPVKKK